MKYFPKSIAGLVLLLSFVCLDAAQNTYSVSFSANPSEGLFYQEDPAQSKVVTNQEMIDVSGNLGDQNAQFLLMSVNDKDYPVYPSGGVFHQTIQLERGVNTIKTALPGGWSSGTEKQVIVVESHTLNRIETRVIGGAWEEASVDASTDMIKVTHPIVRLSGRAFAHSDAQLRAKDGYSQPLMVEQKGQEFSVDHVLHEGENVVLLSSTYQGEPFHESKIRLFLEKVIHMELDPDSPLSSFVETASLANQVSSIASEIALRGSVPAIKNGSLTLTIGNESVETSISDHQFFSVIQLPEEGLHQIKAQVKIGGQTYVDFFDIYYHEPVAKMDAIAPMLQVEGGFKTQETQGLEDLEGSVVLSTLWAEISGLLDVPENTQAALFNQTTGVAIPVVASNGVFRERIELAEGKNLIALRIGDAMQFLNCGSFEVDAQLPPPEELLQDSTDPTQLGNELASQSEDSPAQDQPLTEVAMAKATQPLKQQSVLDDDSAQTPLEDESNDNLEQAIAEGEYTPPVPTKTKKPERVIDPKTYRKAKGFVVVRFTIGTDGNVIRDSVEVAQSDNPLLEREAIRVVREWEFKPATKGTIPVEQDSEIKLLWK
jgi:TonB family protein